LIQTRALSDALGVEVCGVDLSRPLAAGAAEAIRQASYRHGVVCIPGQSIDESDQVRFGEHFGELAHTQGDYGIKPGHPAIMYVTNEKADGEYIGALPDGEMYFHTDMCYREKPSMTTILYAMAIPSAGGNTLFASMYRAYEDLPEAMKGRLAGLKAVNSYEPGREAPMAAMRTRLAPSPSARSFAHPVVCTHPVTGRKALYVNRLMTESIVGLPRAESDALLESLFDHQEQQRYVYEHRWTIGDVLIWDNRCVLHARTDFDAGQLRKLRRVAVKGDRVS